MGNCLQSTSFTGASSTKQTLHESITVSENPADRNIFDYYEKVKHIAQGSTCDIWTIRQKSTGQIYALKCIPKSNPVFVKEIRNEVDILKKMDHPNIVRVYERYEDKQFVYMVLEYCHGGDLCSSPLPYSEPHAAMVLTKILSAVTYLHKNRVVHRDLKPANVMYDEKGGEPKLIDFGLSKPNVGKWANMNCVVGTVATMSPEVIKGVYDSKADVWSVGVIAYCLLSGKMPFDGETQNELAKAIVKGKYTMEGEEWANVSEPAKNFCKSLLTYNPEKRPSAAEALKNPWLGKNAPLATRQPSQESMASVQNALIRSSQDSKLKKVAAMMIAYKSSNESLKELRDAFNAIDVSNHGTITFREFKTVLKDCNFSDEELKEMFKEIDVNNTREINYTEFLAATLESVGRIEDDRIEEAFNRLDADGSGYLSKEELCSVLGTMCTAKNCDKIVNEILDDVDADKDGRISYDDFMSLFREKHREAVNNQCCGFKEDSTRSMTC